MPKELGPSHIKKEKLSEEEKNKLILENLGFARAIAINIHNKLPKHVELDDMVSNGLLGLIDATNKYVPSSGIPFVNYARVRIEGAIKDGLRGVDWAKRTTRGRQKKITEAIDSLEIKLQRKPTEEEVAMSLDLTIPEYRELISEMGEMKGPVSMSVDESGKTVSVNISSGIENNPDFIFLRTKLTSDLEEAIKSVNLPKNGEKTLRLVFMEGKNMKEVGQAMNPTVTEGRVSQILKESLGNLRAFFEENGVNSSSDYGLNSVPGKKGQQVTFKV